MSKDKPGRPLTTEELAAVKPAFEKIDAGYRELDEAFSPMGRRPPEDDDPGGMCGIGCGCSSFLGGSGNICARPFCRHNFRVHLT